MDGISALLKEIPENSLALVWDFPAPRTVRNTRVVYKPPSLWYSVVAAWADHASTHLPFDPAIPSRRIYPEDTP